MQFKIPHKTTRAEARLKIQRALDDARPKLGDQVVINQEQWQGDVLTFSVTIQGQTISGTLAVTDADYDVDVRLPLMLRMFEGRIKQAIEDQAAQLLK